jgi:hypothetical protein
MAGLEHFAAQRSPLADGVVIGVILIVLISYVSGFLTLSAKPNVLGGDFTTLQHQAQNWLAGGPMYPAFELEGPFQVALPGLILYPPVTNLLLVPLAWLPALLWWLVPAVIVGAVIFRLAPRGPWLLVLGFCLAYPNSVNLVVEGNPDMWLATCLAISIYWKPAAAFILLKPSLFPLALFGVRQRGWWFLVGVFTIVSLILLPQAFDWLKVLHNEQTYGFRGGLTYSFQDIPLVASPLVAWLGSPRRKMLKAKTTDSMSERAMVGPRILRKLFGK